LKILVSSHVFYPGTGGIETSAALLCSEFSRLGHEVVLVTQSVLGSAKEPAWPYKVIRRPSARELLNLVRQCDVYYHNNISLATAWPLLFVNRPWVVAVRTWVARNDGSRSWRDWLKIHCLRRATCIANSAAVAASTGTPCTVIGNAYRDDIFKVEPDAVRDTELVFVGRLVHDKGADTLLQALAILAKVNLHPRLTIIGDGPEEGSLQALAAKLGVDARVNFVGKRIGRELALLLNRHQVMVVPSRWHEPFGIVALEGIACGCIVAGSAGGGLPDAIGPCGEVFPNDDAEALASILRRFLTDQALAQRLRASGSKHLEKHTVAYVGAAYLRVMEQARARQVKGPERISEQRVCC
jgi:glycogen synthase